MRFRTLLIYLAALPGFAQTLPTGKAQIDELVLANRMLASQQLGFIDSFGHVSVRNNTNPNHYFIARAISAGMVTAADIIENDLDSKAVSGDTREQFLERFIHGEIYKIRPDVRAIVHAHTPELVAFGVSSVPLHTGGAAPPIFDVRKFANGAPGLINTPALGKSVAESLGNNPDILLLGHGVVIVDASIYGLVHAANTLRKGAQVQMQATALGGQVNYPDAPARAEQTGPPVPRAVRIPDGSGGGAGDDRAWEYWKRQVLPEIIRDSKPRPKSSTPVNVTIEDLVYANRILASQELGVLDAEGHVSVRNPRNPNHYFITRYVSAGGAKITDVIENDLDSKPVASERNDQYQERFMHGEVYRARPDVMAIVHAHTPELIAFGVSSVPLRPVVNQGLFIGDGLPMFDIRQFNQVRHERIVTTPEMGKALAGVLGNNPAVLMTGHGVLVVDKSLPEVVSRAYGLKVNAKIQEQAISLGGKVTYIALPAGAPDTANGPNGIRRAWEYWKRLVSLN
jgi:ribulose-5-phosphate 4-epimerase/fuculose-1-phosphate aldolase